MSPLWKMVSWQRRNWVENAISKGPKLTLPVMERPDVTHQGHSITSVVNRKVARSLMKYRF